MSQISFSTVLRVNLRIHRPIKIRHISDIPNFRCELIQNNFLNFEKKITSATDFRGKMGAQGGRQKEEFILIQFSNVLVRRA